jgi:hypothetical protein
MAKTTAKDAAPAHKKATTRKPSKKSTARTTRARQVATAKVPRPLPDVELDVPSQPFLDEQLHGKTFKKAGHNGHVTGTAAIREAARHIKSAAPMPVRKLPDEIVQSVEALQPKHRSMHGAKYSLAYFPASRLRMAGGDRFGYLSSTPVRAASRLPFTSGNRALLIALGSAMAEPGPGIEDPAAHDSSVDAGMTYVGQFIDHDITLDVSSSLDVSTDAETIHNMRSPSLDLDSVYGRGPALDLFLFDTPGAGENPTAIKMQLGTNLDSGPGGPGGPAGMGGMVLHNDRDVPRLISPDHTAIIGDPRNDENLVIVQLHHAMLRFHNRVVDSVVASGFTGDVFVEAKRIVTHHYQWAVVNDFLKTICGAQAVADADAATAGVAVNSPFRMPVEFSVAAYRFGHSMIRDQYWVNFNFPQASLAQVFQFNRNPHLPVRTNWIVDFNAFFQTGVPVPVFNKARKIDTGLANGLTALPELTGLMARLAERNLLRGLALGLPSGQAMATSFGIAPLTSAEILQGLPNSQADALKARGQALLKRTPLWFYVLREAAVLRNGEQLGPVGGRIVAETFFTMLRRDPDSYLNMATPFTPFLPSASAGSFTFTDLIEFSGMNLP